MIRFRDAVDVPPWEKGCESKFGEDDNLASGRISLVQQRNQAFHNRMPVVGSLDWSELGCADCDDSTH